MTKILDCTTRDGGHCNNWNYSDEYILNLMNELNRNNIDYFEIGYRNYYDNTDKGSFYYCTPNLIKKFYDRKQKLNLGIMVDTKRYNESDFINSSDDCIDFVRIATHPEKISETLLIAERLYKKNYNIMIQLMDITNLTQYHYKLLSKWKFKNILEIIYLADTYGTIDAKNLEQIFNKIKEMGYVKIGFHAHNHTNQALKNAVKAMELGAYSIDVKQYKIGMSGGNLLCSDLIKAL